VKIMTKAAEKWSISHQMKSYVEHFYLSELT